MTNGVVPMSRHLPPFAEPGHDLRPVWTVVHGTRLLADVRDLVSDLDGDACAHGRAGQGMRLAERVPSRHAVARGPLAAVAPQAEQQPSTGHVWTSLTLPWRPLRRAAAPRAA